ncbi:MAG: potassium transporter Kup [Candidatus Riflebacteria bacterium]|nr:potassium transporter Kup [Candidatus Riflebacteria bacterium]
MSDATEKQPVAVSEVSAKPAESSAANPKVATSAPEVPASTTLSSDSSHDPHGGSEDASSKVFFRRMMTLGLGALGVVYGDIGTSPLYSVKECFAPPVGLEVIPANVIGIISLIFWSLTLIVVVKYLTVVMRADNHGEGGIMALLALLLMKEGLTAGAKSKKILVSLALFGTSLLLADGMITPAISVLSAIEGLEVATPVFKHLVVPFTLIVLILLFLVQKYGTGGVAKVFGPIMLIWFGSIGLLGAISIFSRPDILAAINPWYALKTAFLPGWKGFFVLGSVILAVTGAEALYADMGHFGREAISFAWYLVAYPALILNYLGQGALLLANPAVASTSPFYGLAPTWLLYPLVVISTLATIVASQALISGAFSLAQQAMQLGYLPRLSIIHTSHHTYGQIYVPEVNTLLMVACFLLVIGFEESSRLAAAYGVAVMGTMTITTLLMFAVMRDRWGWSLASASGLTFLFLCIDLPFLLSNLGKVVHGGWVPILIGGCFFLLMTTWKLGRETLGKVMKQELFPLASFMASIPMENPVRVRGSAVFMTGNINVVPPVLLHHFKHNKILHNQVVLFSVTTVGVPEIAANKQIEVKALGQGFFQVIACYGFMETPNVPDILRRSNGREGLKFEEHDTSYFLGRESLLTSGSSGLSQWRKVLFAFLSRNSVPAMAFFGIPPDRVLELGMQIEL